MENIQPEKKILIIDDDKNSCETLSDILKSRGCAEIITANDGTSGLTKARAESPDLIILDLEMPKLDGFNLCRMLKFDDTYKDIPIIMLTGRDQESDREITHDVKADAYLNKPLDVEQLIQEIRQLLKANSND